MIIRDWCNGFSPANNFVEELFGNWRIKINNVRWQLLRIRLVESDVASVWKRSYVSWKRKGTIHWTRDQSFMRSAVIRKNLARANSNRWRKTNLRVSTDDRYTRCLTVYLSLWFSCPRFSRGWSRIAHARWRVRHLLPKWRRLLTQCHAILWWDPGSFFVLTTLPPTAKF